MALIDDPGTSMAAFFAGRDAYLKSLNSIEGAPGDLTLDELGEDALDALMACVEAATPPLRTQGIQMALTAVERLLGTLAPGSGESRSAGQVQEAIDRIRAEIGSGGASA
jgi:hypothetical protein